MCNDEVSMGKVFLLTSYFVITPTFLLLAMFFLFLTLYPTSQAISSFSPASYHTVAYAQPPQALTEIAAEEATQAADLRSELVRQFFARYGSPLESHASFVVAMADKYGLDFRLLPAIAMQESNLCKKAPIDSYNCWGFAIYGGKIKGFAGYEQAIETVTKTLAEEYKGKGLHTPEEIVTKYTPSDNGKWPYAVNHFMTQISP